jgi:hypothetical protein
MATNMGKRTNYIAHGDGCPCYPCRRALIREQRSMDPLSFREKVYITAGTLAALGILVLLALAWMASHT